MPNELLTKEQKDRIRFDLVESARKLLGVPYEFGATWKSFSIMPQTLDCSEMIRGIYALQKLPFVDGSQNQWDYTIHTETPLPGDLAFFGREKNVRKVYHVGMVFDELSIIEARGFDPTASFKTGCVILRPREKWENYKNFIGYTRHVKLF